MIVKNVEYNGRHQCKMQHKVLNRKAVKNNYDKTIGTTTLRLYASAKQCSLRRLKFVSQIHICHANLHLWPLKSDQFMFESKWQLITSMWSLEISHLRGQKHVWWDNCDLDRWPLTTKI